MATVKRTPAANGTEYLDNVLDHFLTDKTTTPTIKATTLPSKANKIMFTKSVIRLFYQNKQQGPTFTMKVGP